MVARSITKKIIRFPSPVLDQVSHTYTYEGCVIPGFTQIAKAMGLVNFDGVPKDKLHRKMHIGSAVHLATQYLDEGNLDHDTVDKSSVEPYLNGYKKFKNEIGFEPLLIEKSMQNCDYRYACTVDRIGMNRDKLTIVEIKTSPLKVSHVIQVIAQELCIKKPVQLIILELTKNGNYKPFYVSQVMRIGKNVYTKSRLMNGWLFAVSTYHLGREIS